MREILFRGKDIVTGEWVSGMNVFFVCNKERTSFRALIVPGGRRIVHKLVDTPKGKQWQHSYDSVEVDVETIGQYTGITDKTGRRIFEGDLLVLATSRTHEVKFADGSFYIEGTSITIRHGGKFTIVGNRWDNPELLEEVDNG